jgi:hypothetical protein
MPSYDYVCPEGHVFDGIYAYEEKVVRCRGCFNEPGITDGFNELQLRMARVYIFSLLTSTTVLRGQTIAYRVLLAMPSWMRRNANPLQIVVHRDPVTGRYRFPAHKDAPCPAGFEKVQIDSVWKARQVERAVQFQDRLKAQENIAKERLALDAIQKPGEADLKRALSGEKFAVPGRDGKVEYTDISTPFGKALAHLALDNLQKKREARSNIIQVPDEGFDALSYDRSNREGHADATTNWKTVRE